MIELMIYDLAKAKLNPENFIHEIGLTIHRRNSSFSLNIYNFSSLILIMAFYGTYSFYKLFVRRNKCKLQFLVGWCGSLHDIDNLFANIPRIDFLSKLICCY